MILFVPTEIIIALLPMVGTAIGSICGILISNRLTNYRIEQLEKKVDKHNSFAEKIPTLEKLYDEKFKVVNHRIEDLEEIER